MDISPPEMPVKRGKKRQRSSDVSFSATTTVAGRTLSADLFEKEIEVLKAELSSLQHELTETHVIDFLDKTAGMIRQLESVSVVTPPKKQGEREVKQENDGVEKLKSESREVINLVKQQVRDIAWKAVRESSTDFITPRIGEKALKWLAHVDSENTLNHVFHLAMIQLESSRFDEAVATLNMSKDSLTPELQEELVQVEGSMDPEKLKSLFGKIEKLKTEYRGIFLLGRVLSDKKLTSAEQPEFEQFLIRSLGDMALNRRLHSKAEKTAAEEKMETFTFNTRQMDACMTSVSAIEEALAQTGLQELAEKCTSYKLSEEELKDFISSFDERSDESVKAGLQELRELQQKLSVEPSRLAWEDRLSPGRVHLLRQLREKVIETRMKIDGISTSTMPFSLRRTEIENSIEYNIRLMQKVMDEIDKQLELVEEIHEGIADAARLESVPGQIPPLTLADLWNLDRLSKIDDITKWVDVPVSQKIKNILDSVSKVETLRSALDTLIDILPSYLPGDVLLEEEGMLKRYKGVGDLVFSEMSLVRHPAEALSLYRTYLSKGIFAVQPYFTGSRMHANIICLQDGEFINCEAPLSYSGTKPTFENSLLNAVYRPNFLAQLTIEGRAALQRLFGPLQEGQLQELLLDLYSKSFTEFFVHNQEALEKIKVVATDAAKAFFRDLAQHVASPTQQLTNAVYSKVLSPVAQAVTAVVGVPRRILRGKRSLPSGGSPLRATAVPTAEMFEMKDRMFCSEFASRVITEMERVVNEHLNQRLREKNPEAFPVQFLSPAIPLDIPRNSIHPNRLGSLLESSGAYTRAPLPLATRLLVRDVV